MTKEEFQRLEVGDLIRHKRGSGVLVVTANRGAGAQVVAVRAVPIDNPSEWDLISRAEHERKLAGYH